MLFCKKHHTPDRSLCQEHRWSPAGRTPYLFSLAQWAFRPLGGEWTQVTLAFAHTVCYTGFGVEHK